MAECVITTWRVAPSRSRDRSNATALYAAMLPVTPSTICFPTNVGPMEPVMSTKSLLALRCCRCGRIVDIDTELFLDLFCIVPGHHGNTLHFTFLTSLRFRRGLPRFLPDEILDLPAEDFIEGDSRFFVEA